MSSSFSTKPSLNKFVDVDAEDRKRAKVKHKVLLRMPGTLHADLVSLSVKYGISVTAVCLQLLTDGVEQKLS